MLLAAILAATMAAGEVRQKPVSIYVGPMVRDGFVDTDKGVADSIKDIQKELRKDRSFAVVADEAGASLKLYVISRRELESGGTDVTTVGGTASGGFVAGTGVTTKLRDSRLEALLRVGTYERTFVGQSEPYVIPGTWTRCARLLVKDLTAWVAANRERIP